MPQIIEALYGFSHTSGRTGRRHQTTLTQTLTLIKIAEREKTSEYYE